MTFDFVSVFLSHLRMFPFLNGKNRAIRKIFMESLPVEIDS